MSPVIDLILNGQSRCRLAVAELTELEAWWMSTSRLYQWSVMGSHNLTECEMT